MKYLVLALLGLNIACATSFEKCQKGDEWTRYGSMDACVAIKEKDRETRHKAWENAVNGIKPSDAPVQQIKPTSCFSTIAGNFVTTNCY